MGTSPTTTLNGSAATATFVDTSDWGTGFTGSVTLANKGAAAINGWTVTFNLANTITNIWDAQIISHTGTQYVIGNLSYDATIAAGGNVSFGYQADGGSPVFPTTATLNGATLSSAPILPSITIADTSVTEGAAASLNQTFTLKLSAASTTPVTVAFKTVNGTAVAGTDYDAKTGTVTFAAGATTATVVVATHPGTASTSKAYTVQLSGASGATIADASATGTIVNPALPSITIADTSVTEGTATSLNETFTLKLSAASSKPVTVAFKTVNGTAIAGTDYDAKSGTVTFAAGATTATVVVATHPGVAGSSKAYTVQLSSPTNATIADASATGTIVNLAPPSITIADASVTEGTAASLNETFTLKLSRASTTPVTVAFKTVNGTAIAGTDYDAKTGTVTFAAGATSATVVVATHPGKAPGAKAYTLQLSSPTGGATIGDASGTGTIVTPTPPSITIADTSVTEGAAASLNQTFTLKLSAASTTPVTVAFKTVNGTAVAGTDYDAKSGTVTFAAGATTATVVVATHPGAASTTKAYTVQLSSPTGGATIGDASATGTIVNPAPPSITIADTSVTESTAASLNETFTLKLSRASATPVTVAFKTVNGTALAGTDYDAKTGTVTFAAGATTATVAVATHPGKAAGSKAYTVQLSGATGATIADASATGTIVTPAPPSITIADTSVTEGTAASLNETFTLKLSAASTTPVTVAFKTVNGTAVAGTDYDAKSGTVTFAAGATSATVVVATHPGTASTTKAYTVQLSTPTGGATIGDASATGTIVNPAAAPVPVASVADTSVTQTVTTTASGSTLLPAGFLSTSGNQIVSASGTPVKISAINWYGLETPDFAPQGLWIQNYQTMMKQMVSLGFNAIRLPFSLQLLNSSSVPDNINYSANPDLQGLNGLQVMDKIIAYAGQIGIKIILDDHRSAAGSGPNDDGLWYDSGYTEAQWIADWKMLATRYAGNTAVIGADLSNEPHNGATWGDGSANDWEAAATRAGDAIQTVNTNWLMFVEGVQTYQGNNTWWGGNLMGAAAHPVTLTTAHKVVYSPHEYPASVSSQPWFSASNYPNNLPAVWDQYWGSLYKNGTAPIFVGEYGSKLQTTSDQQWMQALVAYMKSPGGVGGAQGISWGYWDWNPTSGDTGGILEDDWSTVDQTKINAINPGFYHASATTTVSPSEVDFTVSLSAPSTKAVTLHYATADGTAHAGTDYTATSGTVTFAPGDTTEIVAVHLLGKAASAKLTFMLNLTDPLGSSLGHSTATATIVPASGTTTSAASMTATNMALAAATTPTTSSSSETATPASASSVTGGSSLSIDSQWTGGLDATVTLANKAAAASTGWRAEIDTADTITSLWGGTILSHKGDVYIVGNANYNGAVASGSTTTFGFEASGTASVDAHLVTFI